MIKPLKYKNDWYADSYFIGDKRIKTLKTIRIGEKDYVVTARSVSVPYNDMGHEYHSTSIHYFISETVFGIKMTFDLNQVVPKQAVMPVDFTTE